MPPDPGLPESVEFSRRLNLGVVRREGQPLDLEASPAECAALANRFGILGVESFCAALRLTPEPDGSVRVDGRLTARLTQECVVTLEPVPQEVAETVALRLLPPGREPEDGPEDPDEVESAPDGSVDLGEVLAEQLALALDPYPRAPGAELPAEAQDPSAHGFGALARLRRDENKN